MNRILSVTTKSLLVVAMAALGARPVEARDTLAEPGTEMSFNLNITGPVGEFNKKAYPTYTVDPVLGQRSDVSTIERYDPGWGFNLNMGWPLGEGKYARYRWGLGFTSITGTRQIGGLRPLSAAWSQSQFTSEWTFHPNGKAERGRGFYLILGGSLDFETYEKLTGDHLTDLLGMYDTANRTRLGGVAGFGWTTGSSVKTHMEFTYHASLTGRNGIIDPPPSDYIRFTIGWVMEWH